MKLRLLLALGMSGLLLALSHGSLADGVPLPMTVGVDAGGWSAAADIKGSVSYVRVSTTANIAAYTAAGVAVDYVIVGPYNSGGVCALNATTWANSAVADYRAHPEIVALEILNEPGGTWFWGPNALSQANATCYANLLVTVVNAFGANHPMFLASWDGGYASGSNWGQEWTSANPNAMGDVEGITLHPYGGTGTVASSALGNRASVAAAEAATYMPIFITEVGWPTAVGQPSTGDSLQWTETDQATNIYNFVIWARSTSYIKSVVIVNYRDFGTNNWYGITRLNGTHKSSYRALYCAAQGLSQGC
jgi:hypothetical protein